MIPVRFNALPLVIRVFPAPGGAVGQFCPACDEQLVGPTALVYIGPGPDPDDAEKAHAGRWHTGAGVAVHSACAGVPEGEVPA